MRTHTPFTELMRLPVREFARFAALICEMLGGDERGGGRETIRPPEGGAL